MMEKFIKSFDEFVNEALKFPEGKYDEEYKKLITLAQKAPNWEDKPMHDRTTGTHTVEGTYNGVKTWFEFNVPGHFGPNYCFKGLVNMKMGFLEKPMFGESGEEIEKFLDAEITKVAKETGLSSRVPMVWLKAAKRVPEDMIKANLDEFKKAIESMK